MVITLNIAYLHVCFAFIRHSEYLHLYSFTFISSARIFKSFIFHINFYDTMSYILNVKRCELYGFSAIYNNKYYYIVIIIKYFWPEKSVCSLTLSLRNFWHPFSRSVRNYFVDARKNHGCGYKNCHISVTNIARHKICTSLDL